MQPRRCRRGRGVERPPGARVETGAGHAAVDAARARVRRRPALGGGVEGVPRGHRGQGDGIPRDRDGDL